MQTFFNAANVVSTGLNGKWCDYFAPWFTEGFKRSEGFNMLFLGLGI